MDFTFETNAPMIFDDHVVEAAEICHSVPGRLDMATVERASE
jgi:hypothetical protein